MTYPERFLAVVGLGSNLKGDLESVDAQLVRAVRLLGHGGCAASQAQMTDPRTAELQVTAPRTAELQVTAPRTAESQSTAPLPPAGRVVACSPLFATPPWGVEEQAEFRNAVVLIATDLEPLDFLHACQAVEQSAHRTREVHWGPRTLDVDVLSMLEHHPEAQQLDEQLEPHTEQWSDIVSAGRFGAELVLPHPYAHQRAFVLVPWSLLPDATPHGPVPSAVYRVAGRPVGQWLDALRASNPGEVEGVRHVAGPEWATAARLID